LAWLVYASFHLVFFGSNKMTTALIVLMVVIASFTGFVKWTDYRHRKRKKDNPPT